jgi:hypothetical protein
MSADGILEEVRFQKEQEIDDVDTTDTYPIASLAGCGKRVLEG